MRSVSVAFIDDHPVVLEGLVSGFAARREFKVVGTGRCASDAVQIAGCNRPDAIVLDINMQGNAFEAIEKIQLVSPSTKVLAFTGSAGVEHAVWALEAGAGGYVLKGSTVDELADAIRAVLAGETFITPSFATKVIVALRNASQKNTASRAIKLSTREEQIVKLLLQGGTNKEIALKLQISDKTVKHYMTLLMQKLNVRNRLEVIIAAQKMSAVYQQREFSSASHDRLN